MSTYGTDRNLLVGILALQLDLIRQDHLVAAMQQWLLHKSDKLEDILLRQNAIDEDRRDFLIAIAQKHLEFHGNEPRTSLAALRSPDAVERELSRLADPDLDATLEQMTGHRGDSLSRHESVSDTTVPLDTCEGSEFGRYRVLRFHDEGGLGRVSVAEDLELHREVALKEIKRRYADDPISRQRFLVEAEITGRLEHPGIVPVYGLGQDTCARPFYVMRFIRGESLKQDIRRFHDPLRGPQSVAARVIELRGLLRRFVDVCNAVEYAHSRGVLHRDLKPGNIMLGKYGETLVVDWGLARSIAKSEQHRESDEPTCIPTSGDDSSKTQMGTIVGTLQYMSPEQAEGRVDEFGPATDVYCLGATLYCILTGQAPFTEKETAALLVNKRQNDFPPPGSIRSDVPRALDAVCLKAMALRPEDRYPTAAALADEIDLWLADEPVGAYREPWTDRAARFLRRHRTVVGSAAVLLVAGTLTLLVVNGLITRQNRELRIARNAAEASREMAVAEQERAERNLTTARSIALNIVEIAEKQLSGVTGQEGFRENMMDRTYRMFDQIYQQEPEAPDVAMELAKVARMSGNLKRLLRKTDEAEARLKQAIDLLQQQVETRPDEGPLRDYLAETFRDKATLMKTVGRLEEADDALAQASAMISQLLLSSPDNLDYQRTRGTIDLERISLQMDLLELDSALELATRCADTYQTLAEGNQRHPLDHILWLLAVARQGQILDLLDRHEEASTVFATALPRGREWLEKSPDKNTRYAFARLVYWSAAGSLAHGTVTDEEQSRLDEAIRLWENLSKSFPESPAYQHYYGEAWGTRGRMLASLQQEQDAIAAFGKAQTILEALVEKAADPEYQAALAQTLADHADLKLAAGEQAEAVNLLERADTLSQLASTAVPRSKDLQRQRERIGQRLEKSRNAAPGMR